MPNYVNANITDIKSKPIKTEFGWQVKAEINCYGSKSEITRNFMTKEEAEALKVGDEIEVYA